MNPLGLDPNCFSSDGVAQVTCLPSLISTATTTFLIFAGTFALFFIVWGGIRLIMSGGDAKAVTAARQIITYAVIGLIVVLSSFTIVYFIGYLTRTGTCITNPELIPTGGCV